MNYTFHQLRVFLQVVECKSVTEASKVLYLTQPAVSIQLKNLQDQFEIPLTEVIGRKLFITEFGFKIAEVSKEILRQVELIEYETKAFKGIVAGRLRIAVVSTGIYVMPYLLNNFLKVHPGIDLHIEVTNKSAVMASITENESDIGLISILPDQIKLDEQILFENPLFLVGNEDHPEINGLSPAEIFARYPVIFREPGSATRAIQENYFQNTEAIRRKKIQLSSNEAVKQAVMAGLGLSIMPLVGMKNEVENRSLRLITPVISNLSPKWRLIWLKEKKLSLVAAAFLEFLEANKSTILRQSFDWLNNFETYSGFPGDNNA